MERHSCQNCSNEFTIEPDDFSFYKKIKVPTPTFCPECRQQRRLAWFNLVNLYYRNCDLCGKNFVSMYPTEAPYIVYCPKCWWSDNWNPLDFGQDYDFSRPFFDQYNELMHKAPMLGLSINTNTTPGSPYNNHSADLKDCYLTFHSDFSQESACCVFMTGDRECFSSGSVMNCDSIYDCMCIYKSNTCFGTRGNNRFCINCYFVRDCENCQNCFMCSGLKNKKYYFKNKQYTREEYEQKIAKYNFGSHKDYIKAQKEAEHFWQTIPPKPTWDTLSVNYSGSYVFHSKNCHECYDVADAEDCKYCMMLWEKPQKNCYDVSSWGLALSDSYEGGVIGEYSSNLFFCQESGINLMNAQYCKLSMKGQNHFGCVAVRGGKNIIFNKQYNKEEYKKLREKIIKHMDEMPYIDKLGNIYKYGEFFPPELSPFPYNTTFAQLFYPKTREQIEKEGSYFLEVNKNEYKITKNTKDLPDNIKNVNNSILDEVIGCENCSRGFKIIEMELRFLRKMNLPIPRTCPFCRVDNKLKIWVDNMKLKNRFCNKCGKNFKTHWGKDRAKIVYCSDCYKIDFN